MFANFLIYLFAFIGTWIGAGLAIRSSEKLSYLSGISQFTVSFILLGLLSSVAELSVGVNSLIKNDPNIFIGNLVGASIVVFLLIIPILAIGGRKIKIDKQFQGFHLPAALLIIALPSFFILDSEITRFDSLIIIFLFFTLILSLHKKHDVPQKSKLFNQWLGPAALKEFARLFFGIAVIFIAGHFIVEETIFFSEILKVPEFIISLLAISIGTNFPELLIAIRSIFMHKSEVAFAGYVGSTTFNTFFFGLFSIIHGQTIILKNNYSISLAFVITGLILFYIFARTKNYFARWEGVVLIILYLAFLGSHFIK